MKKIILALVAAVTLVACAQKEKNTFNYTIECSRANIDGEVTLVIDTTKSVATVENGVVRFEGNVDEPRFGYLIDADSEAFAQFVVEPGKIIIDDEGVMRDGASPELLMLRRSIREHEGQVSKRLQQVLSSAKKAGVVDAEAMISIRDGRAVIPVSAANKRKLNGFIHDESATGRTFYIEPVEVVELNNQLKELEYAERREIVRILTLFTDYFTQPFLDFGIINVIVIYPTFITGIVRRIDIDTLHPSFVLRQQGFQSFQIITTDNHIFAAVVLAVLTVFVKTVLTLQHPVWHIQMMVHNFIFSDPFKCWHNELLSINSFL